MTANDFLYELSELYQHKNCDQPAIIDFIFDSFYDMYDQNQFSEVDDVLSRIQLSEHTKSTWIAFLSITLGVKNKLKNRKQLFNKIKKILTLTESKERVKNLLQGLE